MSIGERIKKLRKTLDLTQQKFGERVGVKGNTIAQYELGRNEPIDAVLSLIQREFNVNIEWLRTGNGEMFIETSTFSLDEYAVKNNLSDIEIEIIKNFMSLDESTRQAILKLFDTKNTADVTDRDIPDFYAEAPKTAEELERLYPPIEPFDNNGNNNVG